MTPLWRTLRYVVRIALRPGQTTEQLVRDPNRLAHGVRAWLIIGVLYGLVAYIGGKNGFGAMVEPWLPISAERYYLWMGPLTPLIYLLNFLVLAGSVQLLGKCFGARGTFEDTFVVAACTFFLPVFLTMWVFEMPLLVFFPAARRSALGGLDPLPVWLDSGRQIVGVVWILLILIVAVSRVQRVALVKSIPLTSLAAVLAWMVMLTYLR